MKQTKINVYFPKNLYKAWLYYWPDGTFQVIKKKLLRATIKEFKLEEFPTLLPQKSKTKKKKTNPS